MDCPLPSQGQHTLYFKIGAKRANDPAVQISVNHSLDQTHEGLQALISAGGLIELSIRCLPSIQVRCVPDASSSSERSRSFRAVRYRKRSLFFRMVRTRVFGGGEKVCAQQRHRGACPVSARRRTVADFTATRRRRFLCSRGRALLSRVTLVQDSSIAICTAAARKRKFVWRRGKEFERLI
jgi:hypothetical protein